MSNEEWYKMIVKAVDAQAEDGSLWPLKGTSVFEAYIAQSLRWLHRVIEEGDEKALASILEQSKEHSHES